MTSNENPSAPEPRGHVITDRVIVHVLQLLGTLVTLIVVYVRLVFFRIFFRPIRLIRVYMFIK